MCTVELFGILSYRNMFKEASDVHAKSRTISLYFMWKRLKGSSSFYHIVFVFE